MPVRDALATPQLTPRLWLRAPRESDLDTVYALHADPVCSRFTPGGPMRSRSAAAELLQGWLAHWQAHGFGCWAIALRERPELVLGFGGLMRHNSLGDALGLGLYFRFSPESWGQGYASEMAQSALELAFDGLQAEAVQAVVQPANTPSRKTLERLGLLLKGSQADVPGQAPSLLYEITAALWASRPRTPPEPTPFGA